MSEGILEYAVSAALILEYEDVLKRPENDLVFTAPEIDQILDSIIALGFRSSPHFLWRPFLKDPKDDMVLELAVVAGATSIITFNIKDFKDSSRLGLEAITPLDFLRKEKLL